MSIHNEEKVEALLCRNLEFCVLVVHAVLLNREYGNVFHPHFAYVVFVCNS